jgi:hypothetical protein
MTPINHSLPQSSATQTKKHSPTPPSFPQCSQSANYKSTQSSPNQSSTTPKSVIKPPYLSIPPYHSLSFLSSQPESKPSHPQNGTNRALTAGPNTTTQPHILPARHRRRHPRPRIVPRLPILRVLLAARQGPTLCVSHSAECEGRRRGGHREVLPERVGPVDGGLGRWPEWLCLDVDAVLWAGEGVVGDAWREGVGCVCCLMRNKKGRRIYRAYLYIVCGRAMHWDGVWCYGSLTG